MVIRVQKWGNSLAVRIPRSYAADLGLEEDSAVELAVEKGELRLRKIETAPRLDDLIARITPRNRHSEVELGKPKGREAW